MRALFRRQWLSTATPLYKQSTGLVGLPVNPRAREEAVALFEELLVALKQLPEVRSEEKEREVRKEGRRSWCVWEKDAGYRLAMEKASKERLHLLRTVEDQVELEKQLDVRSLLGSGGLLV